MDFQFSNILSQFTGKQKLLVLVMLIVSVSSTVLLLQVIKGNPCDDVVRENKELVKDFVEVSKLLRESQMKSFDTVMESSRGIEEDNISKALSIADRHK